MAKKKINTTIKNGKENIPEIKSNKKVMTDTNIKVTQTSINIL